MLEAGIVTPLSKTLEQDDAAAVTLASAVTVHVVPPTPEPPARALILLVAPTPVADEAALVEVDEALVVVEVANVVGVVVEATLVVVFSISG